MKKGLIKMGALALGMFTFGTMINTSNAATGEISLQLIAGNLSCSFEQTGFNLGSTGAIRNQDTIMGATFGTALWTCIDEKGSDNRALTIQAPELKNTNPALSSHVSSGILISTDAKTVTGSVECTSPTVTNENIVSVTPITLMQRIGTGNGLCKIDIESIAFEVTIPANSAPGTYDGNITLTY